MPADWPWYLLLLPAGMIAGVVNTIAGGGSFLTLPALMYCCGLPPQVANGSNRIAILLQSVVGAGIYRKHGHLDGQVTLRLAVPMLLGAGLGAWLASVMSPDAFEIVFGVLFLVMAAVMLAKPTALLRSGAGQAGPRWAEWGVFAAVGVYAGFIQAGAGVLMLIASALLSGVDLNRANGVKLVLVALIQVVALAIFIAYGHVDWLAGAVLAVGNTLGAPIGAKLALAKGNRLIFGFVLVVMIATGVKLLVG